MVNRKDDDTKTGKDTKRRASGQRWMMLARSHSDPRKTGIILGMLVEQTQCLDQYHLTSYM